MKRPDWLKEIVKVGKKYHVNKQSKVLHCLINSVSFIGLWGSIVALLWSSTVAPIWTFPIISLLLGSCFFAHFILIIHECSHNMFLVTGNKKMTGVLNFQIGKWASVPFMTAYERHWHNGHSVHHARPCEHDDPQNPDPLFGRRLWKKLLVVCIVPFGFATANPSSKYDRRLNRMILATLVWGPIVWLMASQSIQSLLALYGGFVVLTTLNLLKIAQEHGSGLAEVQEPLLRSRTYFYPLSFLFSPFNIQYHFEHHANCSVPWYLLPKYHAEAKNLMPDEIRPLLVHRTYLSQAKGLLPVDGLQAVRVTG